MKHAAWEQNDTTGHCCETVAVFGIGDLGHLAVQFAAKMGFRTWLSRAARIRRRCAGTGRHPLHRQRRDGCHRGAATLGGAAVILVTAQPLVRERLPQAL